MKFKNQLLNDVLDPEKKIVVNVWSQGDADAICQWYNEEHMPKSKISSSQWRDYGVSTVFCLYVPAQYHVCDIPKISTTAPQFIPASRVIAAIEAEKAESENAKPAEVLLHRCSWESVLDPGNSIAIHAKTGAEAKAFCRLAKGKGLRWSDGDLYSHHGWGYSDSDGLIYRLHKGSWLLFRELTQDDTIIPAAEFIAYHTGNAENEETQIDQINTELLKDRIDIDQNNKRIAELQNRIAAIESLLQPTEESQQ